MKQWRFRAARQRDDGGNEDGLAARLQTVGKQSAPHMRRLEPAELTSAGGSTNPENGVCHQTEDVLASRLGVPSRVVGLLRQRGVASFADMDVFLSPNLRHLAGPELWPGTALAAEVLEKALLDGRKTVIWGDYDVDGITGATLALEVLRFHGFAAEVHLPDRRREGYGLNLPEVERHAAEGAGILLTVDCGISDVAAVARARELGLTVVISDHHLPPQELPPADAIVNPRLSDGNGPQCGTDCAPANPCPHLAGVGVAFFLLAALNTRLAVHTGRRMDMRSVLDLVALGTLADMVPLTGQNRILVKNGLLKIAEAKRPGLAELKAASGFSPVAALGAGQVVFSLAPRINAAGRLGSPRLAHDLLLEESHDEASLLARKLDGMNSDRRAEEERIFEAAYEQAMTFPEQAGLVLCGTDWHQGVIGIVASRLVEALYRPVLILCADGDVLKGSGRSVNELDLHAALSRCADLLVGFGGHRQAAGLRMLPSLLDDLRRRFDAVVREELGDSPLTPVLNIDGELGFAEASDFTVLKALDLLQPFGIGNPEPVFVSLPLLVRKRRAFGHAKEHVTLEVTEEASGITLQAKAWRLAEQLPPSVAGRRLRLAFTPGINAYNGIASVELRVKDWDFMDS